jgi:hypothetical protein
MGVYADPTGLEIRFYDKEGKNEIRSAIKGKAQLYSLSRTKRRGEPDPAVLDYSLGSTDWLTDVMVADTDEELKQMESASTGAALTSTCSQKVCVQWKKKFASGQIDADKIENCVTLAVVNPGEEDSGQRFPTKQIYVFPEGTNIRPGHPFWDKWHGTIDYVASLVNEVGTDA